MKKKLSLAAVLSVAAVLIASGVSPAHAVGAPAPPSVNYTFEGNTLDTANGSTFTAAGGCPADPCNSSMSFGTEGGDGYLEWSSTNLRGGGFDIDTDQTLTNTYTLLMKFSFADFSLWRKIIDYLDRTSDTGFYIHAGKINFYQLGESTNSFTAGQAMTLMVTRQATTGTAGIFTVYSYDGTAFNQELQVTDTTGESIPAPSTLHPGGTKLGFFFDDTQTLDEATTSGKVFSVKTWNGTALSASDLASVATAADSEQAPSLPNTGMSMVLNTTFGMSALALFVLAGTLIIMRRRLHLLASSSAASQAVRDLDARLARLENRLRVRPLNRRS